MADSEKPTPKKVNEKELNQVQAPKVQLKPAPKKVLNALTFTTSPLKCIIPFELKKREDAPATQAPVADDIEDEDEVLDSNEEHPAPKRVKKEKKDDDKPHIMYPKHFVCVYKWPQIEVGQKYIAMSVGQESRSRTGIVLVPVQPKQKKEEHKDA